MDCSFDYPKSKSGLRLSVQLYQRVSGLFGFPLSASSHIFPSFPQLLEQLIHPLEGSYTSSSSLNRLWSRKRTHHVEGTIHFGVCSFNYNWPMQWIWIQNPKMDYVSLNRPLMLNRPIVMSLYITFIPQDVIILFIYYIIFIQDDMFSIKLF